MPAPQYKLLREDGSYLLQESGGKILLVPTNSWLQNIGTGQFTLTGISLTQRVLTFLMGVGRFLLNGSPIKIIVPFHTNWTLKIVAKTFWNLITKGD